ncbi:hypothetical protein OIDMADRAFT_45770 [Oidiodendron maius Zn]|uniref:Uncharacterized protein n=1 Tax=Oidiodendron maius (strain Zn) TaxID=913774 RepID=A0A0C3GSR6_OIDMZ|nr:hypothetical protein OIDMADRAFT_45770 [Oidiodendron maius Zn]
MSADKAPAEKLPLAVRKNVRDEWDNKKPEFEAQLLELLGTPWKFDINPLAIYPYAEEGSYGHHSLGSCIAAYADGFIYQLKYCLNSQGSGLKDEMNTVVNTHSVTLFASTNFNYCGCDVEAGVLRLHFHPNCLGTNVNDAASKLPDAISTAPQPEGAPALSYAARHSIKTDYDSKIGDVLEKASKALQNPNLKFEPGFEELGAMLKTGKDVRDDWEKNLGNFAVMYFESFLSALQYNKFAEDDLLREGFEEGVPKGVVKLRLVEKLPSGYNQILLDDGAVVLQTTPNNWGTNVNDTAAKLVDIL